MLEKSEINKLVDIPDVIAHRGFSAENPENTLISYEKAVKAGTTALEGGSFRFTVWKSTRLIGLFWQIFA